MITLGMRTYLPLEVFTLLVQWVVVKISQASLLQIRWWTVGPICRDLSMILKINLAAIFPSEN